MAEEFNIVLEHLKRIQADISSIKTSLASHDRRLSSIDGHLAAFHTLIGGYNDDMALIQHRLDRVERRLDISDD